MPMRSMDRRANIDGRENFDTLRERLTQRLRSVCSHFEADDLKELTVRMVRVQLRYERETAVPPAW